VVTIAHQCTCAGVTGPATAERIVPQKGHALEWAGLLREHRLRDAKALDSNHCQGRRNASSLGPKPILL